MRRREDMRGCRRKEKVDSVGDTGPVTNYDKPWKHIAPCIFRRLTSVIDRDCEEIVVRIWWRF
jgi:hypothetical protein